MWSNMVNTLEKVNEYLGSIRNGDCRVRNMLLPVLKKVIKIMIRNKCKICYLTKLYQQVHMNCGTWKWYN